MVAVVSLSESCGIVVGLLGIAAVLAHCYGIAVVSL